MCCLLVDTIYCDRFCKLLYKLSVILKEKVCLGWSVSSGQFMWTGAKAIILFKYHSRPEETLQLITEFYEKFEENKNILFSCIEVSLLQIKADCPRQHVIIFLLAVSGVRLNEHLPSTKARRPSN